MEVYENGIIRVDAELHIAAVTPRGSQRLADCGLKPGRLTISTIALNDRGFAIAGHWFEMSDFVFSKPVAVCQACGQPIKTWSG